MGSTDAAIIFFLSITGLCSALYQQPPLDTVYSNNLAAAPSIADNFTQELAQHAELTIFSNHFPVQASLGFAGAEPSIDDSILPHNAGYVFFAWGTSQLLHLPAVGHSGYCTATECCIGEDCSVGEHCSSFCDHDEDYCTEYENKTYTIKSAIVRFCFRGKCESVTTAGNLVYIPAGIRDVMQNSSGIEKLSITINATIKIVYEINDKYFSYPSCYSNITTYNASFNFYEQQNLTAEGGRVLLFLHAPVLREQWYRNNRFDTIVLSTSRLSSARVMLNGKEARNASFRMYNVSTGRFGAQHILSVPVSGNASGVVEAVANSTPVFLQHENQTFGYVYEINHTYDGLGSNNLSILVITPLNGSFSMNESILSRALSHSGNMTEPGIWYSNETVRKSSAFGIDAIGSVSLSIGLLGLLVIVVSANSLIRH